MSDSINQKKIKDKNVLNNTVKIENRQELKQLLLDLTEQRVYEKFSDRNLDRENEKIKLRDGREITLSEIKLTIAESVSKYHPIFTHESEYFIEMYRLKKWNIGDAKHYFKKPIVGKYNNEIIYQRFSTEILPILQYLNPYIGNSYKREYKHFQWFTDEGQKKVEIFRNEAVKIMKTCDTWYEFRVKYFIEYGIPYQMDAFEEIKYNY